MRKIIDNDQKNVLGNYFKYVYMKKFNKLAYINNQKLFIQNI